MGAADNLTKREAAIAAFASEQATRIYSLLRHPPQPPSAAAASEAAPGRVHSRHCDLC